MFKLTSQVIDSSLLSQQLQSTHAGAFVSFEGRVRDHDQQRNVTALEYEAYEPLCAKEAALIIHEAKLRFTIIDGWCMHRTGRLNVGEVAVWIGVIAAHRDAAFMASRYIIDEVKKRLPIWKKEYFVEGDSGWVNCVIASVAKQSHEITSSLSLLAMTREEYYSRQISLSAVGADGQKKLNEAKVLVVGAGGLGSSVLMSLAGSGIGTLGIVEHDKLEVSNLHRQFLYDQTDIGQPKGQLAAKRIQQINPLINVVTHIVKLDRTNIESIIDDYDYIVDCTDNFEIKFLLNDACYLQQKFLVQAGIYQFEGQLRAHYPHQPGCLRCLWPITPSVGCVGTCTDVGVIGAIPAVVGHLQALEAIKIILNTNGQLHGETLLIDLETNSLQRIKNIINPSCPLCSSHSTIKSVSQPVIVEASPEIEIADLAIAGFDRYIFIDVRESDEICLHPVNEITTLHRSSKSFFESPLAIDPTKTYVLFCAKGFRSLKLTQRLRREGQHNIYSLKGGVDSLTHFLKQLHPSHP